MLPRTWQDCLFELREDIKKEISTLCKKDITEVKRFLSSSEISLNVWKISLLDHLNKENNGLVKNEYYDIFSWVLQNDQILEALLCSGDVPPNRWANAINILCKILLANPDLMNLYNSKFEITCHQRLAVAIALTYSSPVVSLADQRIEIDAVRRYAEFSNLAANGSGIKLFPDFYQLRTWHLRYVVGSWAEENELEWARSNVPQKFANSSEIGNATFEMVPYKEYNDESISVHEGAKYYKDKPATLQLIHEVGGVCGAVSKFGCAMAQAHGIPAMPVAQPGHCAFLWWKDGNWTLANDVSDLKLSTVHEGVQLPWCTDKACYVLLMNEAQTKFEDYKLSQILRVVAGEAKDNLHSLILLHFAIATCFSNFHAWRDFAAILGLCEITNSISLSILSKYCLSNHTTSESFDVLSLNKPVQVSDCEERARNLVDGTGSEWWTGNKTGWIEIDLQELCNVRKVDIQWWGISVSRSLILLSSDGGDYKKMRSSNEDENDPQDYNDWSHFDGWVEPSIKIKFELNDGTLDPWGMEKYFGIRQILVKGHKIGDTTVLNDVKEIIANGDSEASYKLPYHGKGCWEINTPISCLNIDLGRPCFLQTICFFGSTITSNEKFVVLGSIDGKTFHKISNGTEMTTNGFSINCYSAAEFLRLEPRKGQSDKQCVEILSHSQLSLFGWDLRIKDILHFKSKALLFDNYPQAVEKIKEVYEDASSEVLSMGKPVIVSDCSERGHNLVDGTDTEWWSENETASIEIDLESICIIKSVNIQWWGISISSNISIFAFEPEKDFIEVRSSSNKIEAPEEMNGWSFLKGWDIPTNKIRFKLYNGCLDPWGMNKHFGIRQIVIRGRHLNIKNQQ